MNVSKDVDFKIAKARAQIIMDHPFVASILLRHPLVYRENGVKTMAVDGRGQIYVNPNFIAGLSVPQVVWGLSHEVFHRIGQHVTRMQKRHFGKWNWSTDAWINDTLDECKIGTRIENCVDRKGAHAETCEDIYASLPDDDGGRGRGPKGNGPPVPGEGEPDPGSKEMEGDGLGDDLLNEHVPQTDSEISEQAAQIKVEVAEAAQVAKMRGKLPGVLAKIANEIIDVKTPWYDITERYMVAQTRADYSWRRPNRRHIGNDIYLPTYGTEPRMGTVVVQTDISGSVSQQEIKHYGGHMKRICEQCHPEKVVVIYTDTQVQKVEEFGPGEEVSINYYSGGGTDMTAGIRYCEEHGIEPDVFITLTDGYTPFPEKVDCPTIWCISSDVVAPDAAGITVHFEMEDK